MTDYLKRSRSSLERIEKKILTISTQDTYKRAYAITAQCYRSLVNTNKWSKLIDNQAAHDGVEVERDRLYALASTQLSLGGAHRDRVHFQSQNAIA